MKTKQNGSVWFAAVVLGLSFLVPSCATRGDKEANPFAGLSARRLWKVMPPPHPIPIPPKKPEDIRLYQWWHAMMEADDTFEFKMPLAFYGLVIDQFDQPLAGVTAKLDWADGRRGGTQRNIITGKDGRFSLYGVHGKFLQVQLSKANCHHSHALQSYDYDDFTEGRYHVADTNRPVVFRMWRYIAPEPMYKWNLSANTSIDGKPVWFDVQKAQFGTTGHVAFSCVWHKPAKGSYGGYTVTIEAAPGCGVALSQDEDYLYRAPAGGYQRQIQIEEAPAKGEGDTKFRPTREPKFFVRTADGKYAAIETRVVQANSPSCSFQLVIFYNPAGSRNLEFHQDFQIH